MSTSCLGNKGLENAQASSGDEPIAIVGMSCLFPGAETPAEFWENILERVDCVTDPPPDWQPELFLDPSGSQPDRAYTGRGGYLGDLCRFDPIRFRVVPSSVDGGEPDQFIALRCAHEAVEDAELSGGGLNRDRTGVILGRGTFVNRGYVSLHEHAFFVDQTLSVIRQLDLGLGEEDLSEIRRELKRNLPPLGPDVVPGLSHSIIVGRIANRLDLHGPAYTLDAACASSLLAVEQAAAALRSGRSDAMIAGGVQVSTPAILAVLFCHLEALSRTGSISPFSAEANGTLLGEGCGMVVLKRLSDALRDENRIYALLRAVGVSSDGKGAGILAPRQEGQELCISRAYESSGISPATLGLVEAHGTGIPLGDATELRSMTASFGDLGGRRIALGSVKSMISHLIPAAGIASLIKTSLALYHRVLPPTLHAENPNPDLGLEKTPFYLSTEARPWIHGDGEAPRRAGVNAFGFGGINTHAILEEHRDSEVDRSTFYHNWPVELVVVSADDRRGMQEKLSSLSRWVKRAEGVRLLDLAASTASESGPSRIALCARSLPDLAEKLERAHELLSEPARDRIQMRSGVFWYEAPLNREGKLAFVFPGEGAQYVNMLRELALHFPEVRRQFDLAERALSGPEADLEALPSRAVFPTPGDERSAERRIFDAAVAVESVATANRALLDLVRALGIRADAVVGHSSGEFGALLAAGAIELSRESDLVEAIRSGARGSARIAASSIDRAVLTTVGGSSLEAVHQIVSDYPGLEIAMDNCPHQVVLVGDERSTEPAVRRLQSAGALCERLPWDRPYHTHRFGPACEILREYYDGLRVEKPTVEVWSCATASPYPGEPEAIRELAVRQWRSKVRFRETIAAMHDSGIRIFLEVGPRGNLTSFINDALSGLPYAAVPLDLHRKPGIEQLCRSLGMLAAHGVNLNLPELYRRRQPRILDLEKDPAAPVPRPPILKKEFPVFSIREESLRSLKSRRPTVEPEVRIALGHEQVVSTAQSGDPRLEALRSHQQTMRRFLEIQTQVMASAARTAPGGARSAAAPALAARGSSGPAALSVQETPNGSGRKHAQGLDAATATATWPWLHRIVSREGDSRLVALCELDSERHAFLRDHTFGRKVSDLSPSLSALPVMPLAMTMELMAEAAEALRAGFQVAHIRRVRALRWLAFDEPRRRLRIEAEGIDRESVRVAVYEHGSDLTAIAEGIVGLTEKPLPPRRATLAVRTSRPSRWSPEDLYGRGMFHGPAFQSVRSMDACGERGIQATLQDTNASLLLPGPGAGDLALPVSLIDGVGQVLGLWLGEKDLAMGFPTGMDNLELGYRKLAGPHQVVLQVEPQNSGTWTSDAEVRAPDGRLVLRIEGRRERLLTVPSHIWRYRAAPSEVVFSRAFGKTFPGAPQSGLVVCELDGFDRAFLLEDGAFWALVLSRLALGEKQRTIYDHHPATRSASVSWLLERVVASDAVRLLGPHSLPMADVEIVADERGWGKATIGDAEAARVSFCHQGLDAVAAAFDPRRYAGVGVALEPLRKLEPDLIREGFDAEERGIIEAATGGEDSPDMGYASAWCAKEAVLKALAREDLRHRREIRIESVEPVSGRIGARLPASPGGGKSVSVFRSLRGQLISSLCVLEQEGGRA